VFFFFDAFILYLSAWRRVRYVSVSNHVILRGGNTLVFSIMLYFLFFFVKISRKGMFQKFR
jgi:hypothetical protein